MFFTAYHFLPAREPAVVRRLLTQLPSERVVAMLDLEDSAADALAPERTDELKAAARANLGALFADPRRPSRPLGVRINARGTPYHAADLEAVSLGLRRGHDLAVLLPKAESADDVANVARELAADGVSSARLYLLIESGRGVTLLPELIAAAKPMLAGLILGMIDYSADQRLWPFPGPLSPAVWSLAQMVADGAADAGVVYGHTPCLQLRNVPLMHEIRRRLREVCRGPAGMVTLSRDQTRALLAEDDSQPCGEPDTKVIDALEEARDIVQRFRKYAGDKRSFSVDDAKDRYIPPQEYLAALRFLREHGLSL